MTAQPPPGPAPGQIITFYSYKGGTGRSMALANVGFLLAGQLPPESRGVLMIDWDLEAPGLHRYFTDSVHKTFPRPADRSGPDGGFALHPGLIDFFTAAYALPAEPARQEGGRNEMLARFDRFVISTDCERLSILKAGRFDAEYPERIRRFDWEAFHQRDPDFFRAFRHFLMRRYDYVLIDSRTGLTDTSGICVQQMPEKLVLVFAPNHQNLDGVLDVARRVRRFRIGSSDLRPLMSFPLASRIDGQNERLRDTWRQGGRTEEDGKLVGYQARFEQLFQELYDLDDCDLGTYFDATQVKHDSDYAYGEKIAARRGTTDRLSLGYAFANFTRRLTTLSAPWEPLPDETELAEARRREQVATRRQVQVQSKVRILTWVSIATVLIAAIAFGYSFILSRRASSVARDQVIFSAVRAATDPLEKALLLGELRGDFPPEGGIELAHQVADTPIPFTVLRGHTRAVLAVAFSPDGSRLASNSVDGTTRVWNTNGTGPSIVLSKHDPTQPPLSLAWSPGGKTVLTAMGNEGLQIFDSRTGERVVDLPPVPRGPVLAATFNAKGWLLAANPLTLETRNLSLGERINYPFFNSRLQGGQVQIARFNSSGSRLALATPRELQVLETQNLKQVASFPVELPIDLMTFSADGLYLATSTEVAVTLWNLASATKINLQVPLGFLGDHGPISALAFSPENRFFALACWDGTTTLYLSGGEVSRLNLRFPDWLNGQRGPIRALAFSPDAQRIATASDDGTIRLWKTLWISSDKDLAWADLLASIREETTVCLTPEQRQRLLAESGLESRQKYFACEKSHGR
jgi:WD40 repeat protein